MATNKSPGLTRRESYSNPVMPGLPLWASTSAPYKTSRKFISLDSSAMCVQHKYQIDRPMEGFPKLQTVLSVQT